VRVFDLLITKLVFESKLVFKLVIKVLATYYYY